MRRRVGNRGHPRRLVWPRIDPFDRTIAFDDRPVAARGTRGVLRRTDRVGAVGPIDDELSRVIAILQREVHGSGHRAAAGRPGRENTSALEAGAPRRRCMPANGELHARLIDEIARAGVGSVDRIVRRIGDETARVAGARRGDTARGRIDRMWRAVLPAGEVIPAELMHRGVAQRIVGLVDVRSGEVELAEEAALVAAAPQHLGNRGLIRRHLRIGEVDRENGVIHVGAQRIAPLEHQRAARRAFRHRPEVAEAHARIGDRIDVRRSRGRGAAVAEHLHLVDPDVVEDEEQDVRPIGGRLRDRRCHPGKSRQRKHDADAPTQAPRRYTYIFSHSHAGSPRSEWIRRQYRSKGHAAVAGCRLRTLSAFHPR
jgi:hypothetical protein